MKMILEERAAAAAGLTEGDKKALDFIVANKKNACFLSSYEIAARIGTSPSTVVRLSKKLGYGSFAAFRRALQAEVAGAEGPTLAARSAKRLPMNAEGDFAALAIYTENLSETIAAGATPENDRRIVEAADIVAAARNVYIMGFRACAGFAAAAAVQLSCLRAGVVTPGECRPLVDQRRRRDARRMPPARRPAHRFISRRRDDSHILRALFERRVARRPDGARRGMPRHSDD